MAKTSTKGLAPAVPWTTSDKSGVYLVTPEIAAKWLEEFNPKNRHLRSTQVSNYAQAMLRGEWTLNGEGIIFSTEGQLGNGQHRLAAIVMCDLSIEAVVIFGVDPAALSTIDTGIKRTAADQLTLLGHSNASHLGTTLGLFDIYLKDNSFTNLGQRAGTLTPAQRDKLLDEHPNLPHSVSFAAARSKVLGSFVAVSTVGLLHYILIEIKGHPVERVEAFFEKIATGVELERLDPILRYRNYVIGVKSQGANVRGRRRLALIVKTWNAWNAGRDMTVLTWRTDARPLEDFPIIS